MFRKIALAALIAAPAYLLTAPATAQSYDVSPVLLLESGPSDAPGYRRKVLVHYLNGPSVNVSYAAFNRSEFVQAPGTADSQAVSDCANGNATSMGELRAFEKAEARRKRSGQAPEIVRFCIKNVDQWESRNKTRYLDPIFNGMPHAASLKNRG